MQFVCFENGKRMSAIKKKILNEALVAYRFGKKMEKKKRMVKFERFTARLNVILRFDIKVRLNPSHVPNKI